MGTKLQVKELRNNLRFRGLKRICRAESARHWVCKRHLEVLIMRGIKSFEVEVQDSGEDLQENVWKSLQKAVPRRREVWHCGGSGKLTCKKKCLK